LLKGKNRYLINIHHPKKIQLRIALSPAVKLIAGIFISHENQV
jgi:hypothetical protein